MIITGNCDISTVNLKSCAFWRKRKQQIESTLLQFYYRIYEPEFVSVYRRVRNAVVGKMNGPLILERCTAWGRCSFIWPRDWPLSTTWSHEWLDYSQRNQIWVDVITFQVSWRKESSVIDEDNSPDRYEFLDKGSILVENIQVQDSGRFVCLVSNGAGSARRIIQLNVEGKKNDCAIVSICRFGGRLHFCCRLPPLYSFRWHALRNKSAVPS